MKPKKYIIKLDGKPICKPITPYKFPVNGVTSEFWPQVELTHRPVNKN